jgi:hypothetical protein
MPGSPPFGGGAFGAVKGLCAPEQAPYQNNHTQEPAHRFAGEVPGRAWPVLDPRGYFFIFNIFFPVLISFLAVLIFLPRVILCGGEGGSFAYKKRRLFVRIWQE